MCPDRKQVLDEDRRRLRLYQDRYLADGDLHSDGPGRARRFRWRNTGEQNLQDRTGSTSWLWALSANTSYSPSQ